MRKLISFETFRSMCQLGGRELERMMEEGRAPKMEQGEVGWSGVERFSAIEFAIEIRERHYPKMKARLWTAKQLAAACHIKPLAVVRWRLENYGPRVVLRKGRGGKCYYDPHECLVFGAYWTRRWYIMRNYRSRHFWRRPWWPQRISGKDVYKKIQYKRRESLPTVGETESSKIKF